MRLDTQLAAADPHRIPEVTRSLEERGYDGAWTSETAHDPFLPIVAASYATHRMQLGTAVAVAFARTPMSVAYTSYDLQSFCRGRFRLGLGSQVLGHIERRFSMPWSHPAPRMREFIRALGEIWRAWEEGVPLEFEGDFYRHTLMTPFFTPQRHGHGRPPVLLAAVGPEMTKVAGEVADGILLHSFASADYVSVHVLPVLDAALERRGRSRESFEVSARAFVASGRDDRQIVEAIDGVRKQIAFYASTPAYRAILKHHGMEELGAELHRLSKGGDAGRWETMAALVPDSLLEALMVAGTPEEAADALIARYGHFADRLRVYTPYPHGAEAERLVVRHLHA